MSKKYYVVWEGREPGVYDNWDDCHEQIDGFPGAKYKSFPNKDTAVEAFRSDSTQHINLYKAWNERKSHKVDYNDFPEIVQNAVAVDGACAGNPGRMEYQGVFVATGTPVFHFGPAEGGTNNIAEFLALVHALAWLQKIKRPDIAIYTDSRTALSWVRNKHAKTTLQPTEANAPVLQLVARAEKWLAANPNSPNRILKWQTDKWGEIPADFGRK